MFKNLLKRSFANLPLTSRGRQSRRRKKESKNVVSIAEKDYKLNELEQNILKLPYHEKLPTKMVEGRYYGNAIAFLSGSNDLESCFDLIELYTDITPRVIVLSEWSHLDSKKLHFGE